MKQIAILGSTGSIGRQALEVIEKHSDRFGLALLVANNSADLLIEQAILFRPEMVIIANPDKYQEVANALAAYPIQVASGSDAINDAVLMSRIDIVLTAMVGFAGLLPTIHAIQAGKTIALANKETLVVAGELILGLAKKHNSLIIPVDSEHSAIYQCLVGEAQNTIEKIYLTASGGPFRGKKIDELKNISVTEALNHPNWAMGNKITIDSASLMNKGLEAIEARWLFGLQPNQIDVIVHPQSIVHSLVQFTDGSIKAQMGLPDMKLPILYALSYPDRLKSTFERFNFMDYPQLSFEQADMDTFKNLAVAYQAMHTGKNMPCVMNAANEIAVDAFLNQKIGFLDMPELIEKTMHAFRVETLNSIDDYVATDKEAREITIKQIGLRSV